MRSRQYRRWTIFVFASLLVLLIVPFAESNAQDSSPRTQYESFDLSTPENAVTTFVELFHQRDYAGLFLVFAPQTQQAWYGWIQRFEMGKIVNPGIVDVLIDERMFGFNHTETEHGPVLTNYLFDSVMLFAEERNAFLIDLRGNVEILRSEDSTMPPYGDAEDSSDNDAEDLPVVNVVTSVEGIADEVIFRMVPTPSGRWQVYQVLVPGGDERDIPWSASTEVMNIPVTNADFEGVIFAKENAAEVGLQFEFNENIHEYWTPNEDEVMALEAGIVPFLQGALSSRDDGEEVWGNLNSYRRQYFGIQFDGERPVVYANFFCSDFENWQRAYVAVEDGGNCFFQVMYDPDAEVFSNLRVNGEA